MKFLFISRHTPTPEQHALAAAQRITLEHQGDADAFDLTPAFVYDKGAFVGVVVVHPAAALSLASEFLVGIFENATRSDENQTESPKFKKLHIYDLRN